MGLIENLYAFIPVDRQLALVRHKSLPRRTSGTALFADLSGFTPLTEALVRALGAQRGAEELTRQLDLVYGALIRQVDTYRGAVIGFSGDAITCWFDRDAGRRALAAALAMQNEMDAFRAIAIPGGDTIGLALKAAVVSGRARRFTVGDPNIQLIDVLAGTTLDRLADVEHHANKGQVVTDALTAQSLRDELNLARESGDAEFPVVASLKSTVRRTPWKHPDAGSLSDAEVKQWVLPPVYARLTAGEATFLAELRPAVALFGRFGGIDFENDTRAENKLDAYIRWVQGVVTKYDGILVQLTIGDKGSYFYAAFGAPIAHDDDTSRALHAASELQQPPPELDYITAPQMGVSRGRMRVGTYGGITRRTYGVLGDEVNVAARLMQAAQPGQILVTERVADVTDREFSFDRLPPLQVKGKREPLRVQALVGRNDEHSRSIAEQTAVPLVGRQAELALLQRAVESVQAGSGQVVILTAEAGMGKSRLAAEGLRYAIELGMEWYVGECPSYGTNSSYLVWHSIWRAFFKIDSQAPAYEQASQLQAALAAINPDFAPRAPLLGPALNLPIPDNDVTRTLDARVRKQLLEALLVDCVRARSRSVPVVFLLEDAHWLDALSSDLLEAIVRDTADCAVLIMVTRRPPEQDRVREQRLMQLPNTTVISLSDFSPDEAARLIEIKLRQSAPAAATQAAVIERLTTRAGGNPFFIEELLNYVRDRELDLEDPTALEALELPDSLSSLVLSRLDRLTEPQRSALKVASIIGRQFPFRWLWGVYPNLGETTPVRHDLDRTSQLDLTLLDQPDPQRAYLFRHIVTHQVTYESQPYSTRAQLHGHLGYFLENEFSGDIERSIDLLAHHFDRSEDLAKRREYLLAAGAQAQAEYANDAAISYYRRALALLEPAERIPVLLKLGQVYETIAEWQDSNESYRAALELALQSGDATAAANARASLGVLFRKWGDLNESGRWLDEAARDFEQLNDRAGMGLVMNERGTLALQKGDYDSATVNYQASLAIRRELGERRLIAGLLSNLAILARMRQDLDQAYALNQESLALRREIRDRWGIAASLNNLGMVMRSRGSPADAKPLLEESISIWREIGDRAYLANSLTSLAEVLLDLGEGEQARERLERALNMVGARGEKRSIAFLLENFARLALLEGDNRRAIRLAAAADTLRKTIGVPLPAAEQAVLDGRLQQARAELGDAVATAEWEAGAALGLDDAIAYALESNS